MPTDLNSLVQVSFICALKDKFLSKVTPKNLFIFFSLSYDLCTHSNRGKQYFLSIRENYKMTFVGINFNFVYIQPMIDCL